MNEVFLAGKVFKNESKQTPNGKTVTNSVMTTSKKINDGWQTEYHNLVFWGEIGDRASTLKKGDRIFVKGEINTTSWEKDQKKHYKTQINCRELIVEPTQAQEPESEFAG